LSKCIEDAAVLFKAQLKANPKVKLELNLAGELPKLYGDPAQLSQVLLNLLQNGLYALPRPRACSRWTPGARGTRCFFAVPTRARELKRST
jgi:two-component system NtrC family sensor kinase